MFGCGTVGVAAHSLSYYHRLLSLLLPFWLVFVYNDNFVHIFSPLMVENILRQELVQRNMIRYSLDSTSSIAIHSLLSFISLY